MAAPVDRSSLTGGDTARPRFPWLVLIAALLCVSLLGVVLLEGRQLLRLTTSLRNGSEQRVVQVHRQQIEYLQLREQWQRALDDSLPLDARMLTLRYDIWVGRMTMLREDSALRQLVSGDDATAVAETLRRIDAFVARADPLFTGRRTPSRAELSALHGELVALEEAMNDLALNAAHRSSNELTQRHLTLRQYTQLTIALTAFLSLLVLVFAALALRQMRQLDQRRQALESLAEELRLARADADAANQAKSAFLANMSHEIRTPFQGLLGMLSVLRESGLTARQIDLLRTATESADHLLAIVNDLLDISQLEAGRLTLMPVTVELRTLLQEVEALMRPQAAAKQLALHLDADPSVPEHVVLDPTRVKQILFNLLSNAIKYSERGTVVLDIRPRHADLGDELEFVVTDTGVGMGEATIERLFQRFSRADEDAGAAPPPGTGLGLEISRNLARLMGGDIEVTSRRGEGSRFTFRMPLQRAEKPPAPPPMPPGAGPAAQPLHVLVAEDHATNRQVLAALLESMGHRTHFVADGDEAVAAVRAQRFDLVLMDLHMPGSDGIAATRAIRALPERRAATVPIVALTADAYADTRERCLVAGMNDFLTKPVRRDNLGAVLRQLFGAASGAAPAGGGEPLRSPLGEPAEGRTAPLIDAATVASALQVLSTERFGSLVREFLDQAPATVARLRAAVRDAQPLELRVHAHAARGAALNLGLTALASTAEGLQNGATHLPAHEIARLVQRFEDLLPLTRTAAQQAGLLPEMAPP